MTHPETRYADSDGVSIAYQVVGEGNVDLVFLPMWFSHVELIWEAPRRRAFLERLASFARLILFDQRGTGLSDSVAVSDVLTLEDRMKDVLAVIDAVGSDRPALLAVGNTAALGCYVAAAHPDRTRALVILNGTVRPRAAADYPVSKGGRMAPDADVVRRTWGTPDWPTISSTMTPGERDELLRYHRNSMGPGNAATLFRLMNRLDARDVLSAIHVPTLVMHRTENRFYALAPSSRRNEPGIDDPPIARQESTRPDATMIRSAGSRGNVSGRISDLRGDGRRDSEPAHVRQSRNALQPVAQTVTWSRRRPRDCNVAISHKEMSDSRDQRPFFSRDSFDFGPEVAKVESAAWKSWFESGPTSPAIFNRQRRAVMHSPDLDSAPYSAPSAAPDTQLHAVDAEPRRPDRTNTRSFHSRRRSLLGPVPASEQNLFGSRRAGGRWPS